VRARGTAATVPQQNTARKAIRVQQHAQRDAQKRAPQVQKLRKKADRAACVMRVRAASACANSQTEEPMKRRRYVEGARSAKARRATAAMKA